MSNPPPLNPPPLLTSGHVWRDNKEQWTNPAATTLCHCTVRNCILLHSFSLRWAVNCTFLRWIACFKSLHCSALSVLYLQWITFHYSALHCIPIIGSPTDHHYPPATPHLMNLHVYIALYLKLCWEFIYWFLFHLWGGRSKPIMTLSGSLKVLRKLLEPSLSSQLFGASTPEGRFSKDRQFTFFFSWFSNLGTHFTILYHIWC